ncbi:hypothetical protein GCM10009116_04440 [Brevundimonas basaltis]
MALAFTAVAASAQAQVAPPHVGPGVDPPRYQADQHHQEIDRLRARADQREAFTRRLEVETRLSRLEIEAARQTDLALPPPYRALRSPEEERALRESATARRRDTTAGVEQVDAWLDRPAR